MQDIAYVQAKTANTYEDIMKMPYVVFRSTYKHLRVSDLLQIPEWREGYIKLKNKNAVKNNKVIKQTKTDLEGLIALQSKL